MLQVPQSHHKGHWTPWCEILIESYNPRFYDWAYELNNFGGSSTETKWFNKLYDDGKTPQEAARIIEKAYSIYFKVR